MKYSETEKEALLREFKPLILSSINRYANYAHLYDDLLQEGYEEILRALDDFEPDKNVHLAWFLKVRLKTFFMNRQKYERRRMHTGLGDMEPSYDPFCQLENKLKVERIIASLKDELLEEIVHSYYIKEESIESIANRLDLTKNQVYYLKEKAMKTIKRKNPKELA